MSDDTKRGAESFASLFEHSGSAPRRRSRIAIGDELEVVIAKITSNAAFADVDGKQEVYIDLGTGDPAHRLDLKPGMRVKGRVVEVSGGIVRIEPEVLKRASDTEEENVELVGGTQPALVTGARMKGKVTRIENYGMFVQLDGTTGRRGSGLLPASEANVPRGTDPHKHFTVGQDVEVKILSIDDEGKIRLSIRAALADEERAEFSKYTGGGQAAPGSGGGMGTLGDLLRSKKKK